LRAARDDHSLVIAGRSVEHVPAVRAELEKTGDPGSVVFTGYATDNDLPALYRNASVFAFTSLYEGFGLPVLEAMSYGLPIVSSDAAALPEIGGDAVLYADPGDPVTFAVQIKRVLDDSVLRDTLASRGRKRATEFTWEKTARETLRLYEEMGEC
jgi:glycosyltransferase involved in cell wall biosynthesis